MQPTNPGRVSVHTPRQYRMIRTRLLVCTNETTILQVLDRMAKFPALGIDVPCYGGGTGAFVEHITAGTINFAALSAKHTVLRLLPISVRPPV